MSEESKLAQAVPVAVQGKKRLLHIGGARVSPKQLPPVFQQPDWEILRQDSDPAFKPDVLAEVWELNVLEAGSVDGICAIHILPFLYAHQVPLALAEFRRVLKPGGIALVSVSDLQAVSAYVAEGRLENKLYDSPRGPVSPIDLVYGFRKGIQEGDKEPHRTGFSAITLVRHLQQAGFSGITVKRDWVNLWATAYHLPEEHPKRRDVPNVENVNIAGSKEAELPWWYRRNLQVQQDADLPSDALDVPPQIWSPLGIKQS